MLNYLVDRRSWLPSCRAGTELDDWEGRTFVSVVGFLFVEPGCSAGRARPPGFRRGQSRFYVRRHAADGVRRGVVFPQGDRAAVGSRGGGAPPLRREVRGSAHAARGDTRPCHLPLAPPRRVEWAAPRPPGRAGARRRPGSEEEFITEHYWGYSRSRGGGTVEYRVEQSALAGMESRDGDPRVQRRGALRPSNLHRRSGKPQLGVSCRRIAVIVYRGVRIAR